MMSKSTMWMGLLMVLICLDSWETNLLKHEHILVPTPPLPPTTLYYGGMGHKIVYPGYKLFIEKYPSEVCSKYFFETY